MLITMKQTMDAVRFSTLTHILATVYHFTTDCGHFLKIIEHIFCIIMLNLDFS